HAPYPSLSYGGIAMHGDVRLVTIVSEGDPLADSLFAFGDAMIASAWMSAVIADYGVSAPTSQLRVIGPRIDHDLSLAQMRDYVASAIADDARFETIAAYLFLLYLPDGV